MVTTAERSTGRADRVQCLRETAPIVWMVVGNDGSVPPTFLTAHGARSPTALGKTHPIHIPVAARTGYLPGRETRTDLAK